MWSWTTGETLIPTKTQTYGFPNPPRSSSVCHSGANSLTAVYEITSQWRYQQHRDLCATCATTVCSAWTFTAWGPFSSLSLRKGEVQLIDYLADIASLSESTVPERAGLLRPSSAMQLSWSAPCKILLAKTDPGMQQMLHLTWLLSLLAFFPLCSRVDMIQTPSISKA